MNKRHLFILISLTIWMITLAMIIVLALNSFEPPSWGNPVGDQLSVAIAGDTRVGQRFTAPLPGLYRIDVSLVRGSESSSSLITFHLKGDPALPSLRTATIRANEIQSDRAYPFSFEPIPDSRGRSFYFYLESDESRPADAVTARYSPHAYLADASAYEADEPVAGNLQFQSHYALRTREKVDLFLTRMAAGRPYLLGTRGFYVGLAGVYVLVLGILILQIATVVVKGQAEKS